MAGTDVGCGRHHAGAEDVAGAEERSDLAKRLERVLEAATDSHARSSALKAVAAALRERRLHVRTCAWCGSINLGAGWHRLSTGRLVADLSRNSAATHGICPACFAGFLPDVPYPDETA